MAEPIAEPVTAYCVKDKKKVEMNDPEEVTFNTKRGKYKAMKGTCPSCGTKVFRIMGPAK